MARQKPPRSERTARRAARREARVEAVTRSAVTSRQTTRRVLLVVWAIATVALFWTAASAIRNKVTWYLAVDQLGYLLFARDLLDGRLFHQWPPAAALATLLPDPTDVLAQSYLWDHGVLYSRYAPGFPILLAGWIGLFGERAAHALNPLLFLTVLAVLIALSWRVHRSLWRGTAVAALVLLCPTGVSLWALTPTRDMSAHLCGFTGLALLAGRGPLSPRLALAAGLALGYAASIRPDAVLYLIPAGILAYGRWRVTRPAPARRRALAGGAAAVLLGLAPSLLFYWVATGNPFTPTQAVEVADFFGPPRMERAPAEALDPNLGYPPRAWRGGDLEPVSGEGMKLAYLTATLPGNWAKIRKGYGDVLIAFAAAGLVTAAILRPPFALAIGAYVTVALLFYSCWGRSYGRYLVSIWLMAPLLMVEGVAGSLDLVRQLRRRRAAELARGVAVGGAALAAALYVLAAPRPDDSALLAVTRVMVLASALGLGAAAAWPARRVARFAAPALALALVWLGTGRLSAASPRATYQRPEVERATATVRRTLAPRAVVITSEEIGRPLENLEFYAGVHALYLTDLERWKIPLERAVFFLLISEMEPYLLLPSEFPERERLLAPLRAQYALEVVADIPPDRNYDFFVASGFHGGLPLELILVR
jgi:hypothetical protein